MLENLAYCLNATAPIFLLMLLGLVFRRLGFFSQAFADKLNDFVFKVGLPVMLFKDLVESDFFTVWDGPFVLFCFLATLGSILLTAALSLFCRERPLRGEFIQVGYRSSIALLGAAFLENLYGTAGAASLVIIGAVPLYNVAAVTVLSLTSPQQSGLNQAALKKALKGIVTPSSWVSPPVWCGRCWTSPSLRFCKRRCPASPLPPPPWASWPWAPPSI